MTDVNDPEFRCYELDLENTAGQTQVATVSAGELIGFKGTYEQFLVCLAWPFTQPSLAVRFSSIFLNTI